MGSTRETAVGVRLASGTLATLAKENVLDEMGELFRIEEGFWLRGQTHFQDHLDDDALIVFPQAGELHGIFSRGQIAATASVENRWRDLSMTRRQAIWIDENAALLSYRADVYRADGQPYSALVSSAYVRRSKGWKLIFHQHSPI